MDLFVSDYAFYNNDKTCYEYVSFHWYIYMKLETNSDGYPTNISQHDGVSLHIKVNTR